MGLALADFFPLPAGLGVFAATWDLPLRILVASAVLMIPTSVLALCMSSLTQESRYAGFGWFALWIMGWFTYRAVTAAEDYNTQAQFANQGRVVAAAESSWTHVSLYHTLGRVQNWVFGFSDFSEVMTSTAILVGVTVVSLAILYRRISAPMRI
ncbi:MAG: hypothetical protein HY290_07965 [Planctomycetia bacterium]|nr:hypothetical protein [Planctomycetia bacterium]